MQTTLLGLAIAIILALVTALVAPLVVDWNHYRATFEQEASRLTGLAVHVNGAIEARILPSPRIKLQDVAVGAAGREPQGRVGAMELELGLGPLLRGEVQVTELRLVAPQIGVTVDRNGAVDWSGLSPALRPDALAISRLTVEDGRLTFADANSGARLVLEKLGFDGDIRSLSGPFRGEGTFVVGAERYAYRISGTRAEADGGIKLRLGVDPANQPLTTQLEGTLNFDGGVPQFDGTMALARLVGATLAHGQRLMSDPWQLTGKVSATPAAAVLQDLAFQYGPEERAVNFTGKARLTFGEHPRLGGDVAAVQVDVDRAMAAPDTTHRPPLVLIKSFFETFVATVRPPLPMAVGVAVDAVTVGGTTLQALHGNVGFDGKAWTLSGVQFHAPGFSEVTVSGRLDEGASGVAFSGPATLESADLKTLMAWLGGRNEPPSGRTEALSARGDVTFANDRFAIDRLSAALDQEHLEGRLAYTWAAADRPATLDGELHAAKLDVDALTAFAQAATANGAFELPHEVTLVLDVGTATIAGVEARTVNARIKFDAGVLHIDRLSVGDLGGAALGLSGRIDELSSQPRGRLTLDLDARTLDGLASVVGKVAPQTAETLRLVAGRLAPAKIHGILTVDRGAGAATAAKLELGGDLGALRLALHGDAAGELANPGATVVRVASRLDADDGGALARLLDLDRVLAVDQLPGQMTFSASGPLNGDLRVNGLAAAGGFSATVEGTLHPSGDEPTGRLQLKASAADLQRLHQAMTGQPGTALPFSATSSIAVAGRALTFTNLVVAAGKESVRGSGILKLSNPVQIDGHIEADDLDIAAAAATMLGLPGQPPGAAAWSPVPIGGGAFGAVSGTVTFKLGRAAVTPTLVARDLKGVARFKPAEISVSDIDGGLAGGRVTGGLSFRRDAGQLAAQANMALAGIPPAALVATKANAVDGLVTVKLQADATGLSPAGLVGAARGSGTVALANGHIAGVDPAAFDAAIRAADQSATIDVTKIRAAVGAAMENSRLTVPNSEAEVTIAGGQIRVAKTTLPTQNGAALLLDGVLDLNTAAIDAHMTLSAPAPTNALITARPELVVTVKGPLAAPETKLDVSALVGWLTLRATELQTRRLESLEANRREEAFGPVIRPVSPSVRFLPGGTTSETALRPSAAQASLFGSRGLDRLRPEVPAPAPESHLDPAAPGGTAAALPAPAAAKPAAPAAETANARRAPLSISPPQSIAPSDRSLLDWLFRSQN